MSTKYLTEEQKEFYEELSQKCNDTITSIEMVCFDGDKNLFNALGISLPAGRKTLWAILAYGEKDLYIYVNPTETTILGFRVGAQKKAPKEQLFSFSSFSSWQVEPMFKSSLFGKKVEKYSLKLNLTYNSEEHGEVRGSMLLQTQINAKDTFVKMQIYKK